MELQCNKVNTQQTLTIMDTILHRGPPHNYPKNYQNSESGEKTGRVLSKAWPHCTGPPTGNGSHLTTFIDYLSISSFPTLWCREKWLRVQTTRVQENKVVRQKYIISKRLPDTTSFLPKFLSSYVLLLVDFYTYCYTINMPKT